MSKSASQDEQELKCPRCGAPVTRTNAAEFDASGAQRVEFTCPNQHRTIVEIVETGDDDLDPSV